MALNVMNNSDSVYAQDDANTVDLDPDLTSIEMAALIVLRNTTLKVRLTKLLSKLLIIIQDFLLCI